MASRRRARPSKTGRDDAKHLTPGRFLEPSRWFSCTGSATAGALITSNSIKDGTIQARDIKKGTISSDRLASSVPTQLAKAGTPGPAGPAGPAGATTTVQGSAPTPGKDGVNGKDGAPGQAGKDGFNPATLVATDGAAGGNWWAAAARCRTRPPASRAASCACRAASTAPRRSVRSASSGPATPPR